MRSNSPLAPVVYSNRKNVESFYFIFTKIYKHNISSHQSINENEHPLERRKIVEDCCLQALRANCGIGNGSIQVHVVRNDI